MRLQKLTAYRPPIVAIFGMLFAYLLISITLALTLGTSLATGSGENPITIGTMAIISIGVPIAYSVYFWHKNKREATAQNLSRMLKLLGVILIESLLIYVVIIAIIFFLYATWGFATNTLTSQFSNLPKILEPSSPLVNVFAIFLTMGVFSWLTLVPLQISFDKPKIPLVVLIGFFFAIFIAGLHSSDFLGILNFFLIIIGIFITTIPSVTNFAAELEPDKKSRKQFAYDLLNCEQTLVLSFIILLIIYILSPSDILVSNTSIARTVILFGLMFGIGILGTGLILFMRLLTNLYNKSGK